MSSSKNMSAHLRAVLFTALALISNLADAQLELRPVDEAASHPDFLAFRNELKAVVERRDSAALLATVHKDIKNSFGGDDGIVEFKEAWKIESRESILWDELHKVLSLGGSFDAEGAFIAPYVFSRWPEGLDGFEYVAVTGSNVRVRIAPAPAAPIVDTVSHLLLKRNGPATEHADWVSVTLQGGRTGYINRRYVRSPIDYRAIFKKIDGRWRMTMLVAGD